MEYEKNRRHALGISPVFCCGFFDGCLPPGASQVSSGYAGRVLTDLRRRPGGHNASACLSAAGPHVDHIVRMVDDVQVVLNDHDGCALGDERPKHFEEYLHIQRVQADRWLVKDEDRILLCPADLACELQALRLSAGKARRFLPQRQIGEPQPGKAPVIWRIRSSGRGRSPALPPHPFP